MPVESASLMSRLGSPAVDRVGSRGPEGGAMFGSRASISWSLETSRECGLPSREPVSPVVECSPLARSLGLE
eukprot:3210809-Pyramimonas_sp.AAC.1